MDDLLKMDASDFPCGGYDPLTKKQCLDWTSTRTSFSTSDSYRILQVSPAQWHFLIKRYVEDEISYNLANMRYRWIKRQLFELADLKYKQDSRRFLLDPESSNEQERKLAEEAYALIHDGFFQRFPDHLVEYLHAKPILLDEDDTLFTPFPVGLRLKSNLVMYTIRNMAYEMRTDEHARIPEKMADDDTFTSMAVDPSPAGKWPRSTLKKSLGLVRLVVYYGTLKSEKRFVTPLWKLAIPFDKTKGSWAFEIHMLDLDKVVECIRVKEWAVGDHRLIYDASALRPNDKQHHVETEEMLKDAVMQQYRYRGEDGFVELVWSSGKSAVLNSTCTIF